MIRKACMVFVMESIDPTHPLRRLFAGLVDSAFCTEVGMCNPRLTQYMADLLIDFIHVDRLNVIRNVEGRKLEQIAGMVALAGDDQPSDPVARDSAMYRRIGDYAMFWAGVYPEQLKRQSRRPSDVLLDYVSQGKRCYAIVSNLAGEDGVPPASLFRNLSDDFEHCLYGLGLVRRSWEDFAARHGHSGQELLL